MDQLSVPPSSGNSENGHIVYEAYGTGPDPVHEDDEFGILIDEKDYINPEVPAIAESIFSQDMTQL